MRKTFSMVPLQSRITAMNWMDTVADQSVDPEVIIQRYGRTSQRYEENMFGLGYNGAVETAHVLANLFPTKREKVRILDIAAGTGLCAQEFYGYGFREMDAMDPATGMLDEAKRKGLYKRYIDEILGDNTLNIPDNEYDAATMSSFSTDIMRKLPMKSFEEIIRVVKPGGYVVNTGFYTTFVNGQASTENFRRKLRVLEAKGKWKLVEIKHFSEYLFGEDGGVSVHQIC